jgi:hypothetical protein
MAYVPPHLRNQKKEDTWFTKEKGKKVQFDKVKEVKEVKDNFPVLSNQAQIQIKPSKMDFKELFTRRKELKKRQRKMKYGWVRLTKNGLIDSLTPEQREREILERNERYMEDAMMKIACRIDCATERRMEYEDIEPVILEEYSTEEEYISSEESYVDEDEEGYESI